MVNESELHFPDWQAPLQEVVLEFDPEKFKEEIEKVEALIRQRIQNLSPSLDTSAERLAINDALSLLRIIKQDRLQTKT